MIHYRYNYLKYLNNALLIHFTIIFTWCSFVTNSLTRKIRQYGNTCFVKVLFLQIYQDKKEFPKNNKLSNASKPILNFLYAPLTPSKPNVNVKRSFFFKLFWQSQENTVSSHQQFCFAKLFI